MKMTFDETVTTGCFVCGATSHASFMAVSGFRLVRCRRCDFVFVNPRPTPEGLAKLYSVPGQNRFARADYEPFEYEFPVLSKIVSGIQKYARAGRLLEVGCGRGDLLRVAASRGFAVTGCDFFGGQKPSLERGVLCDGAVREARFADRSFDVAVSRNTLEHVFDPRAELEEIYRVLTPGGYLYLKVPNVEFEYGFRCRVVFGAEHVLEPPYHLNYFSPRSLRRLLSDLGFDVIEWCVEQPTRRPARRSDVLRQTAYQAIRTIRLLSGGTVFPKILVACVAQKPR